MLLRLHAALQSGGQSAEYLRTVWGIPNHSLPQHASTAPTSSRNPHTEPAAQRRTLGTFPDSGTSSELLKPPVVAAHATAAHSVTKEAILRQPAQSCSPGKQEVSRYLYFVPSWFLGVLTCAGGAVKEGTRDSGEQVVVYPSYNSASVNLLVRMMCASSTRRCWAPALPACLPPSITCLDPCNADWCTRVYWCAGCCGA